MTFNSFYFSVTLANNVLETCAGKEIHFSSNQVGSRVIEALLGFTNPDLFESFTNQFAQNFRPICSDRFASHVLQKLVEVSFLRSVSKLQPDTDEPLIKKSRSETDEDLSERKFNLKSDYTAEHIKHCSEFVQKTAKFLLNNLEDFVWDVNANFIIRTALLNLVGIKQEEYDFGKSDKKKINLEDIQKHLITPPEWMEIVLDYAERLPMWPQFPDLPKNEFTSGILQNLCIALKVCHKNKLKSVGQKIIQTFLQPDSPEEGSVGDNSNSLPFVFQSPAATRLLEVIIGIAGNKLFNFIFENLFTADGRLLELSQMKSCNFTVQKLIEHVKEKVIFEKIFDDLSPYIGLFLRIGHTGVVLALVKACVRLQTKQGAYVLALQQALDCVEPKSKADLFPLICLKLKPHDIFIKDSSSFIHVHGSAILQEILKFNKPIKIVTNLLEIDPTKLSEIFCTPNGSHIVDAFIQSKWIGEKSREKFTRHMMGTYLDLAINKSGSRSFEKIFDAAGGKHKQQILTEIGQKIGLLHSTMFGKIISRKYFVQDYVNNPKKWTEKINQNKNKAENLFKDIIN